MSPEERAKAVAERFAAELPSRSVPELERIVTSAIKRALAQQLAEFEAWAERSAEYAMGRGKNGKAGTKREMIVSSYPLERIELLSEGCYRLARFRNA